jgi:hypothetical protein
VSERALEIAQQPDGSFAATFDDRSPAVPVTSWADIRRLRARHRQEDHWADGAYEAFLAAHGHPFDDWWASLDPEVQAGLLVDIDGPVPAAYADAVKRSLRSEPGRDGLRVDGSTFTVQVRDYLRAVSARA